jgi:hypothetical protein
MKLTAITPVLCNMPVAACNKGQTASSTPEHGNQPLVSGLAPEQNALKFIVTTGGDCKPLYAFARELGIDVHSGSDSPAR